MKAPRLYPKNPRVAWSQRRLLRGAGSKAESRGTSGTLGFGGFGAHTRKIQARHVVRGLKSETALAEMRHDHIVWGFRV